MSDEVQENTKKVIDLDTYERKTEKQYERDMTKPELIRLVVALWERVDKLTDQLSARNELLSGTGEEGTLVTAPNREYFGKSYGLQFNGGRAFVPDGLANAKVILQECRDAGYTLTRLTAADYKALAVAEPKEDSWVKEMMQPGILGAK